ncbi:hypothetical protein P691DRAFT_799122 [Macrolepiota fuliginosa MF-IS2]|uniref:Uncharacterized protein n=1 Tax=Macrolepiota fuliginosa MF-IS2 TaxID=1400762 RepID=A0A9P5XI36_9AGAR|nr:hypothetical protein P691DRAFT_799122 [Macrolepiota fuliginosa MF-IS2]
MMKKKDSQNFRLKLKLPAILRSPFSRRGKKKVEAEGEDTPRRSSSSYEVDISTADTPVDVALSSNKVNADAISTRESRTSTDANTIQQGASTSAVGHDVNPTDGRSQSPAPSQARSHRQSVSKATSGENVRVSMTVDTIKQQLNDGLQMLAEFKKSLRPSSDVQRYDEAIGNFEGAAKGLATLKGKLSNRKLAGNPNRNNLKVDFEDAPFSMGIPGIEESQKESTLDVVQENKENEAQEEAKEKEQQQQQQQQQAVWV